MDNDDDEWMGMTNVGAKSDVLTATLEAMTNVWVALTNLFVRSRLLASCGLRNLPISIGERYRFIVVPGRPRKKRQGVWHGPPEFGVTGSSGCRR